MSHDSIKAAFSDATNYVAANISLYTVDPDRNLTRNRKIGADKLLSFMVSCGSSSTKIKLPCLQIGIHKTGNMGETDCVQHDRNTDLSYNHKKGKHKIRNSSAINVI